ncbi:MAG: hypothetical protein PHE27_04775 [Alphaproteobacteria bacterium]|nr:hypothetical protein [Alphaproteobacteria bacterium]
MSTRSKIFRDAKWEVAGTAGWLALSAVNAGAALSGGEYASVAAVLSVVHFGAAAVMADKARKAPAFPLDSSVFVRCLKGNVEDSFRGNQVVYFCAAAAIVWGLSELSQGRLVLGSTLLGAGLGWVNATYGAAVARARRYSPPGGFEACVPA